MFPSVSWDSWNKTLDKKLKFVLNDLIDKLEIYDLTTVKRSKIVESSKNVDEFKSKNTSIDSFDYITEADDDLLDDYQTDDFKEFTQQIISCYDFSLIEINLMIKLVSNENLINLDKNSITAQCLNFSVLKMHSLERNFYQLDGQRKNELKNVILKLFVISLNNLFISFKNICDCFDVELVLSQLYEVLKYDLSADDVCDLKLENCFIIFYSIIVLLNNIFIQNCNEINNYESLFNIFKSNDCELNLFFKKQLFHNKKISKILKILIKITSDFKKCDENVFLKSRKGKKDKQKCGLNIHHGISRKNYNICFMENLLISLLKKLKNDDKKIIFRYFRNNGLCCCNFERKSLPSILELFEDVKMQKSGLNFIKNNILKIFDKSCCDFCQTRRKSDDFLNDFIHFYKTLLKKLKGTLYTRLLNHIGKIAVDLPYNYSQRILFDLIIKIFHQEKNKTKNESILKCCLNIFTFYLKDDKLLEEFFNEEMLIDLKNLLKIPELAQDVLNIIKIGIICSEECDKLIEITLRATVNVTKNLIILFKDVDQIFQLKTTKDIDQDLNFESITNLIKLSAIYWNSIYQLIKISLKFKKEFKIELNKFFDDTTLINTVYNSISCVLNLNRKTNVDLTNSVDFCVLSKTDLFQDFPDSSSCDFIENRTEYRKGIFDIEYDINFNMIDKIDFNDLIIELDENLILTHNDIFNSTNYNFKNNTKFRLIYSTNSHRKVIRLSQTSDENILIESIKTDYSKIEIHGNLISSVLDTLTSELNFITNSFSKIFSKQGGDRNSTNDCIYYSIEDVLQLKSMENRKMLSTIFENMLGVVLQFYTSNQIGEFLFSYY